MDENSFLCYRNLVLVKKILSKNEIEVYTLRTKETKTLKYEN